MTEITHKFRDKEVRCTITDGVLLNINHEDIAALRGFDNADEMNDFMEDLELKDHDQEMRDWRMRLNGMKYVMRKNCKLGEEFMRLSNRAINSLERFLVATEKLHGMTGDEPQAPLVAVQTIGYAADRDDSAIQLYLFLKENSADIST